MVAGRADTRVVEGEGVGAERDTRDGVPCVAPNVVDAFVLRIAPADREALWRARPGPRDKRSCRTRALAGNYIPGERSGAPAQPACARCDVATYGTMALIALGARRGHARAIGLLHVSGVADARVRRFDRVNGSARAVLVRGTGGARGQAHIDARHASPAGVRAVDDRWRLLAGSHRGEDRD